MKGLRNFLLIAGGVGLFMLLVWALSPRQFDWEATFAPASTQPFGMKLFDEVAERSIPGGYTVTNRSFFQMLHDEDSACVRGLLAVGLDLSAGPETVGHIMQLARRGHRVMLVTGRVYGALGDSLGISDCSHLPVSYLESAMRYDADPTPLHWEGTDGLFPARDFYVSNPLHDAFLSVDSAATDVRVLVSNVEVDADDGEAGDNDAADDEPAAALAVSKRVGQGEVLVVVMPLLFTNYGLLAGDQALLVFRFLSLLGPNPIERTVLYTTDDDGQADLLAFVKSQPPLRWAYYMALLTVLVFMVTTARRRQRAVPVVAPPRNHALGFIKLIGTLYHQQHDYADLVRKKYVYTAEQLRRSLHVDITNAADDARAVPVIARNAGLEEDAVRQTLADIRRQVAQMGDLSADQMKACIDRLAALNPHDMI